MGQAPVKCCAEPCSAQPVQMIPPVIAAGRVRKNGKQGFAAMKSVARSDTFDCAYAEEEERLPLCEASVLGRLGKTSWQKEEPLTPELPTLLPQRKTHASLVLGGKEASSDLSCFTKEASSDLSCFMLPPQPSSVARAKGGSLLPSIVEDPWEPSWPNVPTATGQTARPQPSFSELPALACADHSTMLPQCQHIIDMAVLDNALEADEDPKRAKSALTQWYDGASESHSASLHDVPEDLSLGYINGLSCDADAVTCVRRDTKSLTWWYGDALSNASTVASPSDAGDSDEGSFGEDRVEPHCRPTSIETEVFFLFDPSCVEL